MSTTINNRYDFVFLYDVKDGNPNGDPDFDNQPRIDFETRKGLVSDVCIKRKVRNYVQLKVEAQNLDTEKYDPKRYNIFICQGEPLNKVIEAELKDANNDVSKGLMAMCNKYYDVRTFGAVLSTGESSQKDGEDAEETSPDTNNEKKGKGKKQKGGKNKGLGVVRGPVQFVFSRSVDPIDSRTHSITRCCVTTQEEADKGNKSTMGNKSTVSYALYRMHGYVSAFDGIKWNFTEDDLELLWDALMNAFEHDHSAARGEMNARALIIFKHDSKLGNARSAKLFELVNIDKVKDSHGETIPYPRRFEDYKVTVNGKELSPIDDYTKIQDGIAMKVLC
ncbi:MAG: type I CRISPR-associated protein Cas7 [Prevotella sp.]|nr:type I CRISPR-associated protein Cas7 [Prevotella sp.]